MHPLPKKIYAFIDSQNLNLGVRSMGWFLDLRKFRQYLKNKYNVVQAYLFIGYIPSNQTMYTNMGRMGYQLIYKPVTPLPNGKVKGNVDAELVLHAMIQYPNYDKAIIVSGDGDFYCLVEYLINNDKLLHLITPNKDYSDLFQIFSSFIIRIDQLRHSLEYT